MGGFILGIMILVFLILGIFAFIALIFSKETAQGCFKNTLLLVVGIPLLIIAVLVFIFHENDIQLFLGKGLLLLAVVLGTWALIGIAAIFLEHADDLHIMYGLTLVLLLLSI